MTGFLPTTESFDLRTHVGQFGVRRASAEDVPAIVALTVDDPIGGDRETASMDDYRRAFAELDADANQFLAVVDDPQHRVVATMQLTLIPGLQRGAAKRLLIEGVHVDAALRSAGLGAAMFEWALEIGRRHGASLAQLTADKRRVDAHRFYDRIGFVASHEGFKREI